MVWSDRRIAPGERWKTEIERELAECRVAILLVSQIYLGSRFIAENELPVILKRAEQRGLTIFWILLSDCYYHDSPIKDFQAAHDIGIPLDRLRRPFRNGVLTSICESISELLTKRREKRIEGRERSTADRKSIFHDYEMRFTIYPNGYTLSHRKIDVHVESPRVGACSPVRDLSDGRSARGRVFPADLEDLDSHYGEGRRPISKRAFFRQFGFEPNTLTFKPLRSPNGLRRFQIVPPSAGQYQYQWMWGSPHMFDGRSDYSWQLIRCGDRSVREMRVYSEFHRHLKRSVEPAVAYVNPNVLVDLVDKSGRDLIYHRATPIPATRKRVSSVVHVLPIHDRRTRRES